VSHVKAPAACRRGGPAEELPDGAQEECQLADVIRRLRILSGVLAFLIFQTGFQPGPTGPDPIRASRMTDTDCAGCPPIA